MMARHSGSITTDRGFAMSAILVRTRLLGFLAAAVLLQVGGSEPSSLAQTAARKREVKDSLWREGALDSTAVDWSLFPKAYAVLSSERLMHPVDIAGWPAKIGRERQLFVDNYLVADAGAVRRTVHQPVKHPGNPIMVAEEPWEKDKKVIVLQVLRDRQSGKFRMWYTSWVKFTVPGRNVGGRRPTMYAESDDGIRWVRPKLRLLEYNGSKENNWVLYGRIHGLMHHPEAKDPARRYLAAVAYEPPYRPVEGLYLYGSPDGLHWTELRSEPILPFMHKDKTFPLEGLGDTTIVRWDPILKLYVCDAKIVYGQRDKAGKYSVSFRTRGVTTSEDLIHWTRPRMTLYPDVLDDADAQIYGQISFPYESMWLGMLRIYHFARTGWKQVDIELTASHDGTSFTRVGNREIFLPLGAPGSWEPDYTDPAHNGPLLVGDELWFFYRGTRNLDKGDELMEKATGLAKLRRDGFVSIDGADQAGTLTTRPLAFEGRTLHVNADVKPGGELRVGVVDSAGAAVEGYRVEDAVPVVKDSTDSKVSWKSGADVARALGTREHVRLKFQLRNAQLYAFWVD
jgi:hypothetical protein